MLKVETIQSHPIGLNGQNHIVALTPMKFLPIEEFEKRQKSIDPSKTLALMSSMTKITSTVIENKKKAKILKELGNTALKRKEYDEAEQWYSQAIDKNPGLKTLWTNRAICRNTMKKYEDAIRDCESALSIDQKFAKPGF